MFGIMEAISAYILVVGMAALLVAVLVWQKKRTGKTIRVWLFSSLIGIILGATIPVAICYLAGYQPTRIPVPVVTGGGPASMSPPIDGVMMGGPPSEEPAEEAAPDLTPEDEPDPDQ